MEFEESEPRDSRIALLLLLPHSSRFAIDLTVNRHTQTHLEGREHRNGQALRYRCSVLNYLLYSAAVIH